MQLELHTFFVIFDSRCLPVLHNISVPFVNRMYSYSEQHSGTLCRKYIATDINISLLLWEGVETLLVQFTVANNGRQLAVIYHNWARLHSTKQVRGLVWITEKNICVVLPGKKRNPNYTEDYQLYFFVGTLTYRNPISVLQQWDFIHLSICFSVYVSRMRNKVCLYTHHDQNIINTETLNAKSKFSLHSCVVCIMPGICCRNSQFEKDKVLCWMCQLLYSVDLVFIELFHINRKYFAYLDIGSIQYSKTYLLNV